MATDLERAEYNLKRWQSLVEGHRRISVSSPALTQVINEKTENAGLREDLEAQWSVDEARLKELKHLYGAAVARVPGAMDEDLLNLDRMGFLLMDIPDEG